MDYKEKKCLMSEIAQQCEKEYMKKAVEALFVFADYDVNNICRAVWDYETSLLLKFEEEHPDLCTFNAAIGCAPSVEYTGLNCGCADLVKITNGKIVVNTEYGWLELGKGCDHIWQPFSAAELIHNLEHYEEEN